MNAESDFLRAERKNVEKSLDLMESLLVRDDLSEYEVIALGKLLQDIYMGIERIIRNRLIHRGVTVDKTATWHKDLLLQARAEAIISECQFGAFSKLLLFRHLQVHGYGHGLDEKRLRELAAPASKVCREFFSEIM